MKKKQYIVEGRAFECYVGPSCLTNHVSVNIYEIVRLKWKIFRTAYRDSCDFWIFEYDTIDDGVVAAICSYLKAEWKENAVCAKWKEFEEG